MNRRNFMQALLAVSVSPVAVFGKAASLPAIRPAVPESPLPFVEFNSWIVKSDDLHHLNRLSRARRT